MIICQFSLIVHFLFRGIRASLPSECRFQSRTQEYHLGLRLSSRRLDLSARNLGRNEIRSSTNFRRKTGCFPNFYTTSGYSKIMAVVFDDQSDIFSDSYSSTLYEEKNSFEKFYKFTKSGVRRSGQQFARFGGKIIGKKLRAKTLMFVIIKYSFSQFIWYISTIHFQ